MHESLHYVCIYNWFKIQHLPFCEISNLASIFGITYLKSNYLCSFWGCKCKCDNPFLGLAATYILSVLNKSWFCWFLGLLYIFLWFSQAFPYLRLLNIMIEIFKSFNSLDRLDFLNLPTLFKVKVRLLINILTILKCLLNNFGTSILLYFKMEIFMSFQ